MSSSSVFLDNRLLLALGIGLIDEVNNDIQELEKKLQVYSSQVLTDKERPQTTVQTLSPANIKGELFVMPFGDIHIT